MLRFAHRCLVSTLCLAAILLCGCSGGTNSSPSSKPSTPAASFTITSGSNTVLLGNTVQFTAVNGTATDWTVNGISGGSATLGTISSTGLFTAAKSLSAANVKLTIGASSVNASATADLTTQSDVGVSITAPPANPILTASTIALTSVITSAGAPDNAIVWSVAGIPNGNSTVGTIAVLTGGAVSYTAPAIEPSGPIQIIATSVADPSKSATVTRNVQGILLSADTGAPGESVTIHGHFNTAQPLVFTFNDFGGYTRTFAVTPDTSDTATLILPAYQDSSANFVAGTVSITAAQGTGSGTVNLGSQAGFAIKALPAAAGTAGQVTAAVLQQAINLTQTVQNQLSVLGAASQGTVDVNNFNDRNADLIVQLKKFLQAVNAIQNGGAAVQVGTLSGAAVNLDSSTLGLLDAYLQAFVVNTASTKAAIAALPQATKVSLGISGNNLTSQQMLRGFQVLPNSVGSFIFKTVTGAFVAGATLSAVGATAASPVVGLVLIGYSMYVATAYIEDFVRLGDVAVVSASVPTPYYNNAYQTLTTAIAKLGDSAITLLSTTASVLSDFKSMLPQLDTSDATSMASKLTSNAANIIQRLSKAPLANTAVVLTVNPSLSLSDSLFIDVDVSSAVPGDYTLATSWGETVTRTVDFTGTAWALLATPLPPAGSTCYNGTITLLDENGKPVTSQTGCFGKLGTDGIISTVAGDGDYVFSGDGGPATSAGLDIPYGTAVDAAGNLYIADSAHSRIRKVTPAGIISTVAGSDNAGFSGDGGPATSAGLAKPEFISVDGKGNLYITDVFNGRIRRVGTDGIISTVAGNGSSTFSGDGGPATSAGLNMPYGTAVDAAGNLYIADSLNSRIRKVTPAGIISTVAGSDNYVFSGDGGPATSAGLATPKFISVDAAGNLYITDVFNGRIRRVGTDGIISTVAGNGSDTFSGDGDLATSAGLSIPYGTAVDAAGNLYIADSSHSRIRKVTPAGIISTVAGSDNAGFSGDGGPATSAGLANPKYISVDGSGNLYITDVFNGRIRKVTF